MICFNTKVFELFHFLDKSSSSSSIFNVPCTFTALHVLFYGSHGKTKNKLMAHKHFSWLMLLYPKLKKHYYKSILTIPSDNYKINNEFLRKIKPIDKNLYLDYTPTMPHEVNLLNNFIITNNLWKNSFYEMDYKYSPVQLKYKSCLAYGKWKFQFDKNLTKKQYFYFNQRRPKYMTMMTCQHPNLILKTYYHNELKSLFIDIPYENDAYSMLIVLPDNVLEKNQLVDKIFNKTRLQLTKDMFYSINGKFTKYNKMTLPKFCIESEYHLNKEKLRHCDNNDYLLELFGENPPDLGNISKNLNEEELGLSIHTEFICDEYGISLPSNNDDDGKETVIYSESFDNTNTNSNTNTELLINKNFAYMITDARNELVVALGVFVGEKK